MPLILAAGIALAALIITPGWLFYFDVTPKIIVLLIATAVALALSVRQRGLRLPPRTFTALLALTAASLALSTALSTNRGVSLIGTTWREFGLVPQLAVLAFAWLAATVDARPLLRAIAIAGSLAALYGIAQYFGIDPFLPAAGYHIGEGVWTIVRPPGTLGYSSYFATWLVMAAFLSLALSMIETVSVWQWIARASAALCVFAMFLTGTRAAMLGLAAGVLAWLLYRGFRVPRRALVAAVIAVAAFAAFYFSPAGWNLRSRARWYVEDPTGGGRATLWRDSLNMAAAKPITGYGPETFTAAFPGFESPALASQRPDFEYESPHNIFVDALTAQGVIGLAILATLCIYGFRSAAKTRGRESAWLAAAFAAGIASQQFTVFVMPTGLLFYLTAAFLAPRIEAQTSASRIRALVFLPAATVFLYCAVRLFAADHALAQTNSAIAANQVDAAAESFARYTRTRLAGPSADLWYSRSMMNLAQRIIAPEQKNHALAQAYAAAYRAPSTSDDLANAWYNLSMFQASRNDAPAMEVALQHAVAARPNWFKPHWALARLYKMEGRRADSDREKSSAIALDGGKHPELFTDVLFQK
jgi:O-antigen ligase